MTFNEICKTAITKWGVEAQLDQAVEEAAELIQAVNKFKRYNNPECLIEEINDVEIMIGQVKAIICKTTGLSHRTLNRYIKSYRVNKLKRVEGLLNRATNEGEGGRRDDKE